MAEENKLNQTPEITPAPAAEAPEKAPTTGELLGDVEHYDEEKDDWSTGYYGTGSRQQVTDDVFHKLETGEELTRDDFIKAEKKRNLGLTAKQKFTGQILLALLFCYGVSHALNLPFAIAIPFTKVDISIGWLYYPFIVLVIVGASNAVNLTDGLDGLAAGCCVIAFIAYAIYSLWLGMPDVASFASVMAGCCAGFLFFNYHPAKIFMGDTGSLALGGAIAGIAVVTRSEFLLIFLGLIFVLEALSVILQVASFQLTGKRIFKMSPLHHHFELSGWSEVHVVWFFWLIEAVAAAGTLFLAISLM